MLQPGNSVRAVWRGPLDEHLGYYVIEGTRLRAATVLSSSHASMAAPTCLAGRNSEVLVEPGPPHRAHAVAGLQHRPHPFARAARHQAKVTAVSARQEPTMAEEFAMRRPQHDAVSVHSMGESLQDSQACRVGKAQRATELINKHRHVVCGGHGAKTRFAPYATATLTR